MSESEHVNVLLIPFLQTWEFPAFGNLIDKAEDRRLKRKSATLLCDDCLESDTYRYAIEIKGEEVIRHPIDKMEKVEEEEKTGLAIGEGEQAFVLDEKGFVVINWGKRIPVWVALYEGEPWAMIWSKANTWVTHRKLTECEVAMLREHRIPDDQAELYHTVHKRNTPQWN